MLRHGIWQKTKATKDSIPVLLKSSRTDRLHAYAGLTKLFELYQQENTIVGYQAFIKDFPNTPQAITALKAIHRLGLQRAEVMNTVKGYDAYVTSFKNSAYNKQAIQKAKSLALNQLQHTLTDKLSLVYWTDKQQQKELTARKLYNQMRQAEKQQQMLVVDRNNFLLEQSPFYRNPSRH